MPKVSIVGAGNVGSTIALNLIRQQAADIVLLDIDLDMAKGKALDLKDCQATINGNVKINGTNDYADIKNSDIIIITAGKPRKKNIESTREELFEINSKIIKEVCSKIKKHSPKSIIITVTNPVDTINMIVLNELRADRKKVIGAGAMLDTARLKTIIAEEMNVPISAVEAIVIGPHSNDVLPVFSRTKVNGKSICKVLPQEKLEQISQKVKNRGKEIIDLMGSGYYAIANIVAKMVENILLDKGEIISASINLEGEYGIYGVSIGVPVKLGRHGAEIIETDFDEKDELLRVANKLK